MKPDLSAHMQANRPKFAVHVPMDRICIRRAKSKSLFRIIRTFAHIIHFVRSRKAIICTFMTKQTPYAAKIYDFFMEPQRSMHIMTPPWKLGGETRSQTETESIPNLSA